jgi:uncharacterized protein
MLTIEKNELFKAIRSDNLERVKQLVSSYPELLNATDNNGVSGIMYALYTGRTSIAQLLSSKKGTVDLFEASGLGHLDKVRQVVQNNPGSAASFSPDGFSALALAAHFGQRDIVEYLIENGAPVNAVAQNPTRFTALTGALANNHGEIAKILVNNGANVNYRYEEGFSPLMLAVENDNLEITRFLLDHGAEVDARTSQGKSALTFALEKNRQEISALLKERGAKD